MPNTSHHRPLRILLGACAACCALPSASARSESSFTLRFGALVVDGTPWDDHLRALKAGIEARSHGAIALRLYEQDIAPNELALVRDCASNGTFNGVAISNGTLSAGMELPLFTMLELPYLFRSEAELDAVLDGPLFDRADEALALEGLKLGAWSENGWYSFGTRDLPIDSPADLAGLGFRVQESWAHQQTHGALGLRSRPLSTGVVDSFLMTGEIRGFDATPFFTLAAGWANAITHFTLTRHIYQPAEILYSSAFWAALPPELQSALLGVPRDEAALARRLVREVDMLMLDELRKKGVHVIQPDKMTLDAFATATLPVHQTFLEQHPEMRALYDGIQHQLVRLRQATGSGAPLDVRRRNKLKRRNDDGPLDDHQP